MKDLNHAIAQISNVIIHVISNELVLNHVIVQIYIVEKINVPLNVILDRLVLEQ